MPRPLPVHSRVAAKAADEAISLDQSLRGIPFDVSIKPHLPLEWEAGFDRNQTAWSEEAKSLAQKSLNAALRAARENSVRLMEESSRENAALIRKAFDDGFGRMRETLAVAQVIVWLALAAALVAAGITACYILRLH